MKLILTLVLVNIWINLFAQYQFDLIDINPQGDPYVQKFTIYNNQLFFCAVDGVHDYELWISDGTIEGTKLLIDINPNGYSDPNFLTVFEEKLFFSADDGTHGKELWISDGTADGTTMLIDINEIGSSEPKYLTICDNKLYFNVDDGIHGKELWISDGTLEGTQLLKDINPSGSSKPVSFMPCNDKLLFWANESGVNNERLWVSDGTLNGTYQMKDIKKLPFMQYEKFVQFEGKIYFGAEDSINGRELWVSDGSPSGTYMVKDINPFQYSWGGGSSNPDQFIVFNERIFFSANDGIHSVELWVSDGTTDGTVLFKDININGLSYLGSFAEYNDKLYFNADDGTHGKELWVTDGTPQETFMLIDINTYGNSSPHLLTVNADKLFFRATISEGGDPLKKLYVSNGTEEGTFSIEPENAVNPSPLTNSWEFCTFNNKLFFNAAFTTSNRELWMLRDTSYVLINEPKQLNYLTIYPNPTNDKIYIKSPEEMTEIKIFSINCELIECWNGKSKYIELDFLQNKEGLYIISVFNDSYILNSKKIIKN